MPANTGVLLRMDCSWSKVVTTTIDEISGRATSPHPSKHYQWGHMPPFFVPRHQKDLCETHPFMCETILRGVGVPGAGDCSVKQGVKQLVSVCLCVPIREVESAVVGFAYTCLHLPIFAL
jgi:hypothetical protein